jgi:hypothetical protein
MSQRDSGYERKERDLYETPEWVTEAVIGHIPFVNGRRVWEPACGSGKMLKVLVDRLGDDVCGTDIGTGTDFLCTKRAHDVFGIVTNPPYEKAYSFVLHSIRLMEPVQGFVAMLLRTDWDHAKTRNHLFTEMPFAKKLVLTKRIRWFEDSKGQPSFNHAWFIWDWQHKGPPTLAYGP